MLEKQKELAEQDRKARLRVRIDDLFEELRLQTLFQGEECCGVPVDETAWYPTDAYYQRHRDTGSEPCAGARRCCSMARAQQKALRKEKQQ